MKDLIYFCDNPFDYVVELDLLKEKIITKRNLEKINLIIKSHSKFDSFQPGSIYSGYKSVGNLFDIQHQEIQKLKNEFAKHVKKYLNFFRFKDDNYIKKFPKNNIIKSWYVRIKRGGGIDYHIHNSWLSAVFYTKLPDELKGGKLELSIINWGFKKEKKFYRSISPKLGKLIIFPSSLPHKVSTFNSNKYRISIAFDIIPASNENFK